ncbi:hypothetical protein BDZ45DRAFT_674289 [Acephala macrosclerotiorum]|nr:hypothetical protein BDZ45DRAFT_674289 [Acephala macrosclerotiorum]
MSSVQNTISSLGACFAAFQPQTHAAAKQYLRDLANDPANAGTIIPRQNRAQDQNCFLTMKLSVNFSLAAEELATNHASPWSVVTFAWQLRGDRSRFHY